MDSYIDIVFDGPPSHESGRFVEVEDMLGKSFSAGEWIHRDDGLWALRIPDHRALLRELTTAREQIAGLEREQARDAVEWADLCLVHKKEAEAARTALAEKEAENTRLRAELAEARQDCQRLDTAFNNLRAERNRPAEFWKNTNPRQG